MSEPYVGQIEVFAFGFAPRGWAICQGQTMAITQNQALFALLGTQFGGNGTTNFVLPDLRGHAADGYGVFQGQAYPMGKTTGTETVTLTETQMPAGAHTHNFVAINNGTSGGSATPGSTVMLASGYNASSSAAEELYANTTAAPPPTPLVIGNLGAVGGAPHENRMPYLAVNYCICLSGLFPSRG
jgi:microcystin-dependent protein